MTCLKVAMPLVTIAASVAAAQWLYRTKPAPPQKNVVEAAPPVDAIRVERRAVSFPIYSQGTVEPRRQTTLAARVAGQIVSVAECFDETGFFEKDTVLVTIDQRDYDVRIRRLEASLRSAQAHLAEASQALQRQNSLRQYEATTDAEVQQAQATAEMGEAAVAELEAQLAEARNAVSDTQIIAPFDGCIRETFVQVGQFVTIGTPLATCFATDAVEIRLPVDDDELAFLELPPLGQALQDDEKAPQVTLEAGFAGGRRCWSGRIVRSEAVVDTRSRMVYLVARVDSPYRGTPESGGHPLAVGMFVEATVRCAPIDDAILLPESCVNSRGELFLIDRENRLKLSRVEVIRREGDWLVARGGLPEGMLVCSTRVEGALPGMAVEIVNHLESGPWNESSGPVVNLVAANTTAGADLAENERKRR